MPAATGIAVHAPRLPRCAVAFGAAIALMLFTAPCGLRPGNAANAGRGPGTRGRRDTGRADPRPIRTRGCAGLPHHRDRRWPRNGRWRQRCTPRLRGSCRTGPHEGRGSSLLFAGARRAAADPPRLPRRQARRHRGPHAALPPNGAHRRGARAPPPRRRDHLGARRRRGSPRPPARERRGDAARAGRARRARRSVSTICIYRPGLPRHEPGSGASRRCSSRRRSTSPCASRSRRRISMPRSAR